MHRGIKGLTRGDKRQVDHRNGKRLDNRRSNLRVASHGQNQQNRPANKVSTTGLKGVIYHKRDKHYLAAIRIKGKRHWLGYFGTAAEAAKAYNKAARKFHGKFARLNKIGD